MSEARRTRRAIARFNQHWDRATLAFAHGRRKAAASWFQPPRITAGRWVIKGERRPELFVPDAAGVPVHVPYHSGKAAYLAETEHWADALLKCPTSSLNHRTVRFCGKPYHWRQDYTGQLKLAAGESPW